MLARHVTGSLSTATLCVTLVCGGIVCSPTDPEGGGPGGGEEETVMVTITSPAGVDTTVAASDTSINVAGTLLDVDNVGVMALLANGDTITSRIEDDAFSCTVSLDLLKQTMLVIVTSVDNNGGIDSDTLTVYRDTAGTTIPEQMGRISGTLYKPANGLEKVLSKRLMASNAAGKTETVDGIPLSGADILAYNADSVSTASSASTKSDSTGRWELDVEPGNYFIFAVYFDQVNVELITSSLQNVKAEEGQENVTEERVALSDDISPMLLSFLDAEAADDNNTFLASDVPQGLPIMMAFSEPMNRNSVGGEAAGIVLGEIDPQEDGLKLKDTIPVAKLWGASSKTLQLVPESDLEIGKYYKVVIPSGAKDLALNKLGTTFYGIVTVIDKADLPPFAVAGADVEDGAEISVSHVVEIYFNRPVDGVSLNGGFTLAPEAGAFMEVRGTVARLLFGEGGGLSAETDYVLTIDSAVKDLLGDTLDSNFTRSFSTKAALAQAAKDNAEGRVAGFVEQVMEAYLAQDFEAFSQYFSPLLEVINISTESDQDGEREVQENQSYTEFMQERRNEAAQAEKMATEGVLFPAVYEIDGHRYWKMVVKKGVGTATGKACLYVEDMGPEGMAQPRVLDCDKNEITSQVDFRGDTLVHDTVSWILHIPVDHAFFSDDKEHRDPFYFGNMQDELTNVEMVNVKIVRKEDYEVHQIDTAGEGDEAHEVLLHLVHTEQRSNESQEFTTVTALNFTIVEDNGVLLVRKIVSKDLFQGESGEFASKQDEILNEDNFVQDSFMVQGTKAIELTTPEHKAVAVSTPVTLSWEAVEGVGGYLVGISDELSGGHSGLLMFTTGTSVTIAAGGQVTDATILSLDPQQVGVPLPYFDTRLDSLETSAVYSWKVIGITDSAASSVGTQLNVIADSDFGELHGWGIFTLSENMPDLSDVYTGAPPDDQPPAGGFEDSDGDMFPDWIELALGTNPRENASWPNMTLDSDKDGIADFFEDAQGTDPEDPESKPQDVDGNHIPDVLEAAPEWDKRLEPDADNDGFPDEIEFIYQTDPWNPDSKPQEVVKGSSPVGTYMGYIWLQSAQDQPLSITITLYVDSSGNPGATIDSTELDVVRPGEVHDLVFEFSEWVFYYPITTGVNTGRLLKVRIHAQYGEIEGAVDVVDSEGSAGPNVGRLRARTDGDVDPNEGGGSNPDPGPVGPEPGEIGPPPGEVLDLFTNPPTADSGSGTLELVISDEGDGLWAATLSLDGEAALSSVDAVWQPYTGFPQFRFVFVDGIDKIEIDGAVFQEGSNYYLGGGMMINGIPTSDYGLLNSSISTVDEPSGIWAGYYTEMKGTGPTPGDGPLPYIGSWDVLEQDLNESNNKGKRDDNGAIIDIVNPRQEGYWKCDDAQGELFQILEEPGNPQAVLMDEDDEGNPVISVRPDFEGGEPGPGNPPYNGDRSAIESALSASGDQAQLTMPGGRIDVGVDPASVQRVEDPGMPGESLWVVNDVPDDQRQYMFLGGVADDKVLWIDAGKPVLGEMGGMPGPGPGSGGPPYEGDLQAVTDALNASGKKVTVVDDFGGTFMEMVDPATVRTVPDPADTGRNLVVADDIANPQRMYVFVGQNDDPNMLMQDGGVPVVFERKDKADGPVVFDGERSVIEGALSASGNLVAVASPGGPQEATVDSASLQRMCDPQDNTKCAWFLTDSGDSAKQYTVLADPANPQNLMLDAGRPMVEVPIEEPSPM